MSRQRTFAALLALSVALGAAWVGTTATAGAAASSGNGQVDKAGVIKFGADLAILGGIRFDPTTVASPNDWYYQQFIYDSLLRQNADGSYSPGLAKSATVTDPQAIVVELRPNLKFSDDTPLDADAVKFSIERMIAAGNVGAVRAELSEVASITVDSPTKLTIALKTPIAGQFYNLLAHGETMVVSPTAAKSGTSLDDKPVGAGPFLLKSYTPERSVVFEKNLKYFQAKKIKLAGVELVQVTSTDPQAGVNALLDNIVDAGGVGTLDQVSPLEAGGLTVKVEASDSSFIGVQWCKSQAPLDNVKVRQALNYAVDRNQINELIYQGQSEPMWATWTQANTLFNPKLKDYYKYNPKKAKALLEEAGASNISFDLYAGPLPETQRIAEILKEQWAKVGVTANLVNFTNIVQEFFTDNKAPAGIVPLRRGGLDKVTRVLVLGSIGDKCNYDDPKLNAMVDTIRKLGGGSKEFQQAWWDLDAYIVKNALHVYLVWSPNITAYNPDRVGNVTYRPDVFGQPRVDVFKTYIKK
ncbi:MAG: ABC transporter substrate-binding protein [Acidimicrobiia bacterium]